MDKHRHRVGETVRVMRTADPRVAPGIYEVVRLLPAEDRDHQYRVKSRHDGHERVVRESDLG